MNGAIVAAWLIGSCVPIRHVDRGHGPIVEAGRCADLLNRENVACRDDTRVSGKAIAIYLLWGASIVLLTGTAFVIYIGINPPGPTHG